MMRPENAASAVTFEDAQAIVREREDGAWPDGMVMDPIGREDDSYYLVVRYAPPGGRPNDDLGPALVDKAPGELTYGKPADRVGWLAKLQAMRPCR